MMRKRKGRIRRILTCLILLIAVLIVVKPAVPVLLFPKACTYAERAVLSYDGGIEYERTWSLNQDEIRALSKVFRGKWFMRKDFTEAGGFPFSPKYVFEFSFPFGITKTFSYDDYKHQLVRMDFPGSFRALTDEERADIRRIIDGISEDETRFLVYSFVEKENATAKLVFDANGIFVLKTENGYDVVFGDIWDVPDKISFDAFGTLLSDETNSTIRAEKAEDSVLESILTETDMISVLGKPIISMGAHEKMAIYITDDGKILYLMLTGDHMDTYELIDITYLEEK